MTIAAAIERATQILEQAPAARDRSENLTHAAKSALINSGLLRELGTNQADGLATVQRIARVDSAAGFLLARHLEALWLIDARGPSDQLSVPLWSGFDVKENGPVAALVGTLGRVDGALLADRFVVASNSADDATNLVIVDATSPGVSRGAWLQSSGLSQLGSASVAFADVAGNARRSERGHLLRVQQWGRLANLHLVLGICEAAIAEAKAYTLEKSRPWVHSSYQRHADDPFVRRIYGKAEIGLAAWNAMLSDPAKRTGQSVPGLRDEITAIELFAFPLALRTTAEIFEVMGARSATRANGFDRFWRDVRSLTLHASADRSATGLGETLLSGTRHSAFERSAAE